MNTFSKGALCLVLACSLVACQGMKKQDVGVITGGAAGALLGSQFGKGSGQVVTTALGAVAGAVIGGAIGNNMDKTDQLQAQKALETARTNQTVRWSNPDSGNTYAMTPTRTYQHQGQPCREYVTKAWIDGKEQKVYGKACRQSDGNWKVVQ